jgi:hypothetical protein
VTIALVQEADAAGSTVTLSAPAAGNTLIVAVACLGSSAATGVTGITAGGAPDNFTLLTPGPSAQDTAAPGDFINVGIWADVNLAAPGGVIAVAGMGVVAVWAWEFSGLDGAAEAFQVVTVPTYQASWLSGLPQTTAPAQALIAVTCAANQAGAETVTVNGGGGWTVQAAHTGTVGSYFWGAEAGYQLVNDATTVAWNGRFSPPSFSATALLAFPAAAAPAPGAPAPPTAHLTPARLTGTAGGAAVTATAAAVAAAAGTTANQAIHGNLTVEGTINATGQISRAKAPVLLTPTAVKTGNYTALPGDYVIVQGQPSTPITITMPSGAATGTLVGVKLLQPGLQVLVQASGPDVFDALSAGTTELQLVTAGTSFVAQYRPATTTWYLQSVSLAEPATNPAFPNIATLPAAPAANSAAAADLGFATWSYDPVCLNSPLTGTALSSGVIYLVQCQVRATVSGQHVYAWITSAGSGLTSGQNFAGVYSAEGNLLGTSNDVTTAFGSTGAFTQSLDTYLTASPPFVWIAFLSNGTTPPSLARTVNQAGILANGQAGFPRFGTVPGSFTSLPSSFSTGSLNNAAAAYFAAFD